MNVQDAAYRTVHDYPGGSESLAPRLGMSAAVLRGKVNPNNDRNILSLHEASQIMGVSDDFQMLHALAASHGFGLHALESGDTADIATRFGVSRSSAYRWAYSLEQARLLAQTMEIPRGAGHRTPVQADTEARAQ